MKQRRLLVAFLGFDAINFDDATIAVSNTVSAIESLTPAATFDVEFVKTSYIQSDLVTPKVMKLGSNQTPVSNINFDYSEEKSKGRKVSTKYEISAQRFGTEVSAVLSNLAMRDHGIPDQLLILDLASRHIESTNQSRFIFDPALPPEFIYFENTPHIDYEYSTAWILLPFNISPQILKFQRFIVESFQTSNAFNSTFRMGPWPHAMQHKILSTMRRSIGTWAYHRFEESKFTSNQDHSRPTTRQQFIARVEKRLSRMMARCIDFSFGLPVLTGEISAINPRTRIRVKGRHWLLNPHAKVGSLLKYFIFSEGLHDRIRFIGSDDFNQPALDTNSIPDK